MNKINRKEIKATIHQLSTLVEDITNVLDIKADPKPCFNEAIQIYEKFIELFQGGEADVAAAEISEELESFENIELHIAVAGETGSGKSSFINAIRGLSAEDNGAAPVGVTETTLEPTPYQNCSYPNIIFWDLPGLGSPAFSPKHYLSKVKFSRYDFFFIIVCSERLKSNHIGLVQQILQMNKKCYFVRSKLDSDLDNEQHDHPRTYNEKQEIEKIRHNCNRKLGESFQKSSPPFFLISSWNLDKYDFPILVQTLQNDLPSLKRLAFLLSLPNFSPEIIAKKKADLKKHIWKISLVSAFINAIPAPELPILCDIGVLLVSMVAFYKKFELDATFLECEICTGIKTCKGDWKICPKDKNSCAITVMEHEGAHGNFLAVQKSCVYYDDCHLGLIDLTYGEGQFMRENTFCCSGSPCVTPPLEFSSFRSKVQNGKICPGCSSLSSVCLDEVVHCKGADSYCFGFVTYKEDDTINSTTKGCTTKDVCTALNRYRGTILRGTELQDIACEPAKDVLVKVAPSPGFTFLALLLMNHLM